MACSHVRVEGVSLAASEARIGGMPEGCWGAAGRWSFRPELVVAWARLSMVELKTTGRTQEPLGGQVSKAGGWTVDGVSASELRGKSPGVWLVSFQDMWDSSEGLDFGLEELCAECVEYEMSLDSWVPEPRGELQLEMGARAASGTGNT